MTKRLNSASDICYLGYNSSGLGIPNTASSVAPATLSNLMRTPVTIAYTQVVTKTIMPCQAIHVNDLTAKHIKRH